jgi:hypothetical protein
LDRINRIYKIFYSFYPVNPAVNPVYLSADVSRTKQPWVTDGLGRKLKLAGNLGEVTDQEKRTTEREVQELIEAIERLKTLL